MTVTDRKYIILEVTDNFLNVRMPDTMSIEEAAALTNTALQMFCDKLDAEIASNPNLNVLQ